MLMKEYLEKLNLFVNFEDYRKDIEDSYTNNELNSLGYDVVLLFRIILLQKIYSLSDADAVFQISDRLSMREFLGLTLFDNVPEVNIICNFRKHLMKTGLFNKLFENLTRKLKEEHNLKITDGMIREAFIVKKNE